MHSTCRAAPSPSRPWAGFEAGFLDNGWECRGFRQNVSTGAFRSKTRCVCSRIFCMRPIVRTIRFPRTSTLVQWWHNHCTLTRRTRMIVPQPFGRIFEAVFLSRHSGRVRTPSDAPVERSRRGLSSATVFVMCTTSPAVPFLWRNWTRKSCVLSPSHPR